MPTTDPIVIVAATRTPMGGFQGALSPVPAPELGANVLTTLMQQTHINSEEINEVILGCVLPAGLKQAPARQATLLAKLSPSVGATTINKVCGSGMKATMLAHDLIKAESADIVIAGGMESMSNAPYLLPQARQGMRMGHGQVIDHMMQDGLENAYDGQAMGCFAQNTADENHITREQMDEFAINSLHKAQQAIDSGAFKNEISAVTIHTRKGEVVVAEDEQPKKARPDKIPQLRPVFAKDGTVTAANSSSISDGAAGLMLMRESLAKAKQLKPLARIIGHSTHSQSPETFTTAPVGAINKLLDRIAWQTKDVDLFEINEAFAMVTMLAIQQLHLDPNKVNIYGGACALGHPIGASGARIIVTLLHALQRNNLTKGIASLCIGGGEATAIAIERIS